MENLINQIICADCFDIFPQIENESIDAIICDLPFGVTMSKWDSILPFDKLWEQYERIIKKNGRDHLIWNSTIYDRFDYVKS